MKIKIGIIALVLLLTLNLSAKDKEVLHVTSLFTNDTLKISDLYLQGVKNLALNRVEDGYNILLQVVKMSPQHAPSLYKLSTLNIDKTLALTFAQRAAKIDNNNVNYKYQLAALLSEQKMGIEAIKVCKDIVKLDHKSLRAHAFLAYSYNLASQPIKALETLDSALVIFENCEEVLTIKQQIIEQNSLYNQGVENIKKLLKISPNNIKYLISAAEIYSMSNNDAKTAEYYSKAEAIDPTDLMLLNSQYSFYNYRKNRVKEFEVLHKIILNNRLNSQQKFGIITKATSDENYYRENFAAIGKLISTLRIMHPSIPEIEGLYATHLIRAGEFKKAIEQYTSMVESNISDKTSLQYLLTLEYHHYNNTDSLKSIPLARRLFKEDIDVNILISSLYRRDKKHKEGINLAKETIAYCKSDSLKSEVYGFIGDSYQYMNNSSKCYRFYKKALKHNPDNIVVLNNYSYYLSEEGKNLDKALVMSQKVMEKEPDNATYIDTYGWILYKMGHYEQAKNTLRKAIALDQYNNPEILLHMGDIFMALGNKMSAESYWNRAAKAGIDKKEIDKRINGTK